MSLPSRCPDSRSPDMSELRALLFTDVAGSTTSDATNRCICTRSVIGRNRSTAGGIEARPATGHRSERKHRLGPTSDVPLDLVRAPGGSVFPGAIIPLEHDLLWRVLGIKPDVGEEFIPRSDAERFLGLFNQMLAQAVG